MKQPSVRIGNNTMNKSVKFEYCLFSRMRKNNSKCLGYSYTLYCMLCNFISESLPNSINLLLSLLVNWDGNSTNSWCSLQTWSLSSEPTKTVILLLITSERSSRNVSWVNPAFLAAMIDWIIGFFCHYYFFKSFRYFDIGIFSDKRAPPLDRWRCRYYEDTRTTRNLWVEGLAWL